MFSVTPTLLWRKVSEVKKLQRGWRGRDEGITWLWCKVLFMSPFSKPGHVPASARRGTWAVTTSPCGGPGLGGPLDQLTPALPEPALPGECSIFHPVLEDRRILALVLGSWGAKLGGRV